MLYSLTHLGLKLEYSHHTRVFILTQGPGDHLNVKMPSYQYRDSHVKDKTVSPTVLSLTWESLYLGKTVFILRQAPGSLHRQDHYSDVIMSLMASPITSLTIVYSTIYSDADHRKHQSSASLAFVQGIHQWPVNSLHKGPVARKMFSFDDVIMTLTLTVLDIQLLISHHEDFLCGTPSKFWEMRENTNIFSCLLE